MTFDRFMQAITILNFEIRPGNDGIIIEYTVDNDPGIFL